MFGTYVNPIRLNTNNNLFSPDDNLIRQITNIGVNNLAIIELCKLNMLKWPWKKRYTVRKFDYLKLIELSLPARVHDIIAKIHECKVNKKYTPKTAQMFWQKWLLCQKIQSTRSSNAIEGIYTNETRLKELMNNKAKQRKRDEEEIVGYRRVLDLVHDNYLHIEFNKSNILTLHNQLYSYSFNIHKGNLKTKDNSIVEVDSNGNKKVRFQPVSSFETERYFDEMIKAYSEAIKEGIPPLLIIPTVIHDFLCIHAFYDGNGRMSRILTLLLLYKADYFVGKYISIEMLIEESKDTYFETLQKSSENWYTGENNELPFIKYMLWIILKAYQECEDRFKLITKNRLTSQERVLQVFKKTLKPLSKSDILILLPALSQRTVERALKELQDNIKIKQIGRKFNQIY